MKCFLLGWYVQSKIGCYQTMDTRKNYGNLTDGWWRCCWIYLQSTGSEGLFFNVLILTQNIYTKYYYIDKSGCKILVCFDDGK